MSRNSRPKGRDGAAALSLSRDMIGSAREALAEITARPHPDLRTSSSAPTRRKSINRMVRHYRPALIGATRTPDSRRAAFAMLYPIGPNSSRIEGLAVFQESMEFGRDRTICMDPDGSPPVREAVAHIDIHVMKRLVERCGLSELGDIIEALKPALGWSLLAERSRLQGNFFIPSPEGLLACERAPYLGDTSGAHVVRIKTFIHEARMSAFNRAARQILIEAGGDRDAPSVPSLSDPTDRQLDVLDVMRRVGREWEERRVNRVEIPDTMGPSADYASINSP